MIDVAIIGHGVSPVGKGWGARIDGCDIVVRMWCSAWQDAPDWGARTDFALYAASWNNLDRFAAIAHRVPARAWWVWQHSASAPMPDIVKPKAEFVPGGLIELCRSRGKALGGKSLSVTGRLDPTSGTVAACHAAQRFTPARLILVGFDAVEAGNMAANRYPDAVPAEKMRRYARLPKDATRCGPHDYRVEAAVIAAAANDAGAEMHYARHLWR